MKKHQSILSETDIKNYLLKGGILNYLNTIDKSRVCGEVVFVFDNRFSNTIKSWHLFNLWLVEYEFRKEEVKKV